jgi:predicted O-linked N-acetylglucosamine transferase (SPINDLY family)
VETPESPAHYTETLVPLENYPFHYERPNLEAPTLSREALGVGPEQHIYACVQSLFKLHPDTDALFGEILRQDPDGVLLLLSHPSEKCNRTLYERFARSYPDVADRVRFVPRLPRADFLGLLAMADVLLDSIHFSGGNTSYEGLAFGTPIVTLDTPYMKGRLTLGLYKRLGLMDAVAATPGDYITLAVRYGTDPAARARLREEILARCPVLYSDEAPVRELEVFLMNALEYARMNY